LLIQFLATEHVIKVDKRRDKPKGDEDGNKQRKKSSMAKTISTHLEKNIFFSVFSFETLCKFPVTKLSSC